MFFQFIRNTQSLPFSEHFHFILILSKFHGTIFLFRSSSILSSWSLYFDLPIFHFKSLSNLSSWSHIVLPILLFKSLSILSSWSLYSHLQLFSKSPFITALFNSSLCFTLSSCPLSILSLSFPILLYGLLLYLSHVLFPYFRSPFKFLSMVVFFPFQSSFFSILRGILSFLLRFL